MIWLFPGKDGPLTAENIVRCIRYTEEARRMKGLGGIP